MAATKPGAGGRGAVTVAMSNALSDIYRKEETIRRAHLDKQLEEILAEDPNFLDEPPPRLVRTVKDHTMERLETLRAQRRQLEEERLDMTTEERVNLTATDLSKSMWRRCNPGMTIDNTYRLRSTSSVDYDWKPDEIEPLDKSNNRRRDDMTEYLNAKVRFKGMMKS